MRCIINVQVSLIFLNKDVQKKGNNPDARIDLIKM